MSVKQLNIHELKASFSFYAREVLRGKRFIIAIRNKAFAELRPLISEQPKKLQFGLLRGEFQIKGNFNAPLRDFEDDFYGRK